MRCARGKEPSPPELVGANRWGGPGHARRGTPRGRPPGWPDSAARGQARGPPLRPWERGHPARHRRGLWPRSILAAPDIAPDGHGCLPPGYSTQDVSLNSLLEPLPQAGPYSSIRIQHSGAPDSVVAEVSSVEQSKDLVVDTKGRKGVEGGWGPGTCEKIGFTSFGTVCFHQLTLWITDGNSISSHVPGTHSPSDTFHAGKGYPLCPLNIPYRAQRELPLPPPGSVSV